ncbi:uncharacterized protein LOC110085536 isoform X2 [Pogona vitticeps]
MEKNCLLQCSCNSDAPCSPITGECSCPPGWIGRDCKQPCPEKHYGEDCSQSCNCKNGAVCHHVTGVCACAVRWRGLFYEEECEAGKYGENCQQNCHCSQGGVCDHRLGKCICHPGWIGVHCDTSMVNTAFFFFLLKLVCQAHMGRTVTKTVSVLERMKSATMSPASVAACQVTMASIMIFVSNNPSVPPSLTSHRADWSGRNFKMQWF